MGNQWTQFDLSAAGQHWVDKKYSSKKTQCQADQPVTGSVYTGRCFKGDLCSSFALCQQYRPTQGKSCSYQVS